jgi:hypothetical protein
MAVNCLLNMSLKSRLDSKNHFYAGPVFSMNDFGFILFYKKRIQAMLLLISVFPL